MPAVRAFLSCLVLFTAAASLACGSAAGDDDDPPTAQEQASFCHDLASTRNSLADVRDALLPLDEAAMQQARAGARADLDYLDSSSRQLQGGADQVADLRADLMQLEILMASPSLVSVTDDIRAQVAVISADLDELEASAGCP